MPNLSERTKDRISDTADNMVAELIENITDEAGAIADRIENLNEDNATEYMNEVEDQLYQAIKEKLVEEHEKFRVYGNK